MYLCVVNCLVVFGSVVVNCHVVVEGVQTCFFEFVLIDCFLYSFMFCFALHPQFYLNIGGD